MKKIILATTFSFVAVICANAQVERLDGPRVGVTYISAGSTADFLRQGLKMMEKEYMEVLDLLLQHNMAGSGKLDLLMEGVMLLE